MSFSNLVELKTFNVFPEYFIGISALYILIVIILITYNVYGLILQKAVSECMGLILLLACYLILNDDLVVSTNGFGLYSTLGFYKSNIMDYFAVFTKCIVCFFSALYFFIIADFLKDYKLFSFEYLLVLLFAVLGLMMLCSSNDLLTAYLSIELVSLSSYILAAFKKTSSYSVEAGIKYLVIGAISSAFFLLGSSFIYAYSGSLSINDLWSIFSDETWFKQDKFYWQQLYSNWHTSELESNFISTTLNWDQWIHLIYVSQLLAFKNFLLNGGKEFLETLQVLEPFLEVGITFVIFSLFIKLALAPFHLWSLDVYEGSPTISTFFFAVITKLSFFVFLVRFSYIAILWYHDTWQFYTVIIGLFSVFVGSFGGLRQRKLKTLLAYSSVSHMGYALLAFSASTRFGVGMLLFYLVIYMLSGLCVWFIVLALKINKKSYTDKYNKELGDLILLHKSNPSLAFSLALTMFSIAGIPPLIGFFAKMGVFLSILYTKYYFIALLTILCSVVSTFYYIRIIKVLYFENLLVGKLYHPITTVKTIFFSFSIILLLFLFINPSFLYLIIYKVVYCSFPADIFTFFFFDKV